MYARYMPVVNAVVVGLAVVAVVSVVHLVLRWMDRRGWVFYGSQPSRPIGTRSAMALIEFETLVNPAAEHVLEYRRYGDLWIQDVNGDDPDDTRAQTERARMPSDG